MVKSALEENDPEKLRQRIGLLETELRSAHKRGVTPLRMRSSKKSHTVHGRIDVPYRKKILVGLMEIEIYDDDMPGEIKIMMEDGPPFIKDLIEAFGVLMTTAFQYGVPLEVILTRFARRHRHDKDGIVGIIAQRLQHEVDVIELSKKEPQSLQPKPV